MDADHTRDYDRLARAVRERRLELELSIVAAAAKAGVAAMTYRRIEEGDPVRDVSYVKVDAALGWVSGSCREILRGRVPLTVDLLDDGDIMYVKVPTTELEDGVKSAITDAVIAVSPDLTARDIHALHEAITQELKKRGILPE